MGAELSLRHAGAGRQLPALRGALDGYRLAVDGRGRRRQ